MDQRAEIEEELERIKNQFEDKSNEPHISYDKGLIIILLCFYLKCTLLIIFRLYSNLMKI